MDTIGAMKSAWNTVQENGWYALTAAKKAAGDVEVINNLLKTVTTVTSVFEAFLKSLNRAEYMPAPVKALSNAFNTVSSFFSARKWVVDLAALGTGDAANKNRLFGFPNILAISSKAAALVADGFSTLSWLVKIGVINNLPQTWGAVQVFGREIAFTMKDLQDSALLTSATIELADNARLLSEKGLSMDRAIDVGMATAKITIVAANRAFTAIGLDLAASVVCGSAALFLSTVSLIRWGKKLDFASAV